MDELFPRRGEGCTVGTRIDLFLLYERDIGTCMDLFLACGKQRAENVDLSACVGGRAMFNTQHIPGPCVWEGGGWTVPVRGQNKISPRAPPLFQIGVPLLGACLV